MLNINKADLFRHHEPRSWSDRFALGVAKLIDSCAGGLLSRRYGHRVIVLETVAAVPSMVAATLLHLKCLRLMIDDRGWIRAFMEEAENQRAHLMAFVALKHPRASERLMIALAQGVFYNAYFLLYLISARTAHRLAAYLAEQSVRGYSDYLRRLDDGSEEILAAPPLAVAYWDLAAGAMVNEMIVAIREDEAIHRDIHHAFADALVAEERFPDRFGPTV